MTADADLISKVEELFRIKTSGDKFTGLVFPSENDGLFAYNMPALEAWGHVYQRDGEYIFEGGIRSIDDSGMTLHSKPESLEKARYRLDRWKSFIEDQCYKCPSKDDIDLFCHQFYVFPSYW